MAENTVLLTGGAGFIGSALARLLAAETDYRVVIIDALTYAGNFPRLEDALASDRVAFVQANICDGRAMQAAFATYRPTIVLHLAAETHVDRSIDDARAFIDTNIMGTFTLLEQARHYLDELTPAARAAFRFLHVSTDEVFGSLGSEGHFDETSRYQPNSPYAASKAAADHLARAWHRTYGLPVIVCNGCNTYGPYQFPEKLIPLMLYRALRGEELPVYGRGENVRDWLYVEDHARALLRIAQAGRVGETYCIGSSHERRNIDVVRALCRLLDELAPRATPHETLIRFVPDRPGHDLRYALDASKLMQELDWRPRELFESGLRKTVHWYLANRDWQERVMNGVYAGQRLGLALPV